MKYWRGHTALLFHCEWHSESNKVAVFLKTLSHLKGRCSRSFPLPTIELVLCARDGLIFFFQAKVNFFYIRTVGTSAFTPLNRQFSTQTLTPYDRVEKRELIFTINDYYCSLICLEVRFSSVSHHSFHGYMLSLNWKRALVSSHFFPETERSKG